MKDDLTVRTFRELRERGADMTEVASMLGVHRRTLERWAKALGLPPLKRGPKPRDWKELKKAA